MSESATKSVATSDVIDDAGPIAVEDAKSPAPVVITEQQVMFGTAVALSRRPSVSRRLIDAIRVVGSALRPPPPKRHYPQRSSFLEHSLMAREMDRL